MQCGKECRRQKELNNDTDATWLVKWGVNISQVCLGVFTLQILKELNHLRFRIFLIQYLHRSSIGCAYGECLDALNYTS